MKVRKRRDAERLMIIPEEVLKHRKDVLAAVGGLGPKRAIYRLAEGARALSRRYRGFNSHSLRYAFITYMAKKGVAPQIIAKMTQHAKLDYILHYTSTQKAERILEEEVL